MTLAVALALVAGASSVAAAAGRRRPTAAGTTATGTSASPRSTPASTGGPPGSSRAQVAAAVAGGPVDPQLQAVLEIIEINDPDVLLINEFDTGTDGDPTTVRLFAELAGYPYCSRAPSNTGIPSGFDLDNNGTVGGGNDAFGFGEFQGQFGMAVFSKYPIEARKARTFQTFRWADMPGAMLPVDPSRAVVVLAGGAGRPAAVVEEPLGRADRRRARP